MRKRWVLGGATLVIVAIGAVIGGTALGGDQGKKAKSTKELGQMTGLLPRDHLTLESAINVDLDKETVRLPLYKGEAGGKTVWYTLLDASDSRRGARPGPEFRAQARQHRDQLSGVRADGDARFADPRRKQVRPGAGPFPGRAGLQPDLLRGSAFADGCGVLFESAVVIVVGDQLCAQSA